jgi:hypothetical protein
MRAYEYSQDCQLSFCIGNEQFAGLSDCVRGVEFSATLT